MCHHHSLIGTVQWILKFLVYGSRYVLGAVETFLKAVPAAGIFRGND